jgi:hypothetical protein
VDELRPAVAGLVADALRRAVGRDQLGELLFQLAQLAVQQVVLLVADLGPGLDVIEMIVAADEVPQLQDPVLGLLAGESQERRSERGQENPGTTSPPSSA